MASRSIEAGKAFLRLLVDDKELKKGLDGSLKQLDSFAKSARRVGVSVGLLGAAITAPFAAAVKVFTSVGSELQEVADRTGLGVRAISELKYAADQSGASLSAVEAAARAMAKTIDLASSGSSKATGTLSRLGVTVAELQSLSPDQQFERLGKAVAAIPDPTERAALAMRVFGKSGTQLLPMLRDMDKLKDRAAELGVTMNPETAAAAKKFGDAMTDVKAAVTGLAVQVGAQLAPALTSLANSLAESTAEIAKWVGENSRLVSVLAILGPALLGLGAIVSGIGDTMRGVIFVVRGLGTALQFFSRQAWLAAAATKALRVALDLLAKNPYAAALGLALTAITAIVAKLTLFTEAAGDSASGTDELADAQGGLAESLNSGTTSIEHRTEALKRLTEAQRAAVSRVESRESEPGIAAEADRLRMRAAAELERDYKRLDKVLADINEKQTTGQTLGGQNISLGALEGERDKLQRLLGLKGDAVGNVLFSDRRDPIAGTLGDGLSTVLPQAFRDAVTNQQFGTALQASFMAAFSPLGFVGGGGADNVTTDVWGLFKKMEKSLAEVRGTFSGRLSSQILGGGMDPAARDRKEQIKLAKETRDYNRTIARKTFLLRTGNT